MIHTIKKHSKTIHAHVKNHHKKYIIGGLSSWLVTHFVLLNAAIIKLILFKVALFSFTAFGLFWTNPQHAIAYEQNYISPQWDIYNLNEISSAKKQLKKSCNKEIVYNATITSNMFVDDFNKSISIYSNAIQLDKIKLFYKKINLINNKIPNKNQVIYCKQKYILYNIQDKLQSQYISLLKNYGLIWEKLLWNRIDEKKKEILLPILNSQLKTIQEELKSSEIFEYFKVNNISFHTLWTEQTKILKEKIILITENTIKKVLADMLDKSILDNEDIQILWDKINVKYLRWCDATHGAYTISRKFDETKLVDLQLKNLTINVNLCPSYQYLHELSHYVEDIFSHEIWHHIYYFKDKNPWNFEKICRDKKWIDHCQKEDFVSNYAQSRPEEDYAETFLHRYKKDISNNIGIILDNKIDYFTNL